MWEGLLILTIVLVVVTLVGHGIWAFVAMVIRAVAGRSRKKQPSLQLCPSCGRSTPAGDTRCDWCGAFLNDQQLTEMADYSAFVRHLRYLEKADVLSEEEAEKLLNRAKLYHQHKLEYRRAVPVSPATEPRSATPPDDIEEVVVVAELVDEPAPTPVDESGDIESGATGVPPVPMPVSKPSPDREGAGLDVTAGLEAARVFPEHGQDAHDDQTPSRPREQETISTPRRSWAELLETFMEERNMRWGELIGGLLIVGGGIALAISLREQLQTIPYSQFVIFATITAGIFGAGFYSHYRWRLKTTSRGLLTIAMLLVPVSFLIMAQLAGGDAQPITLAVEAAGLALFGYLGYQAGRVLVPDRAYLAALGVLGNSAVMLALTPLIGQAAEPFWYTIVGLVPTGVLLGTAGGYLVRREPRRWLGAERCAWLLTVLGTSFFAWMVAEGHYLTELVRQTGLNTALELFSIPLTVAAAPLLLAGLVLLRRTALGEDLEGYRTTGTTIAMVAMSMMLAALGTAWPWAEMILAVGLFSALLLAAAALRYRAPILHAGTIFCTALVTLVGYHATIGQLFGPPVDQLGRELLERITSAASGNLLGGLFVVSAVVAEWLVRLGRRRDARVYAVGCGVLAVVGISLVTWHGRLGGPDALRAAILYAVYGMISVGLAARWNKLALSYLGLALVQASLLWAAWWQQQPLWLALLVFSTATTVIAVALRLIMRRREVLLRRHVGRLIVEPCSIAALLSVTLALPWLLLDPAVTVVGLAGYLTWTAALATTLAFLIGSSELLAVAQVVWAGASLAAARTWLLEPPSWSWPDACVLQVYGIALAAVVLAWNGARIMIRRNRVGRRLLDPAWPMVDQLLYHLLVLVQWLVLMGCLLPHVADELGIKPAAASSNFLGMPIDVGPCAWMLLGLLAIGSLARMLHRFERVDLLSLLFIVVTAAGLVAGRFAGDLAVASALRWALAVVFLLASILIWSRTALVAPARHLGARTRLGGDAVLLARGLLVATTALPIVAISSLAAVLKIADHLPTGPVAGTFFDQIGPEWSYLIPLATVVVVLVGYALRDRSAAHAFAAGTIVELAVALGYLLWIGDFGTVEFVRLVQLVTITSAVWAIAWLVMRRWTDAWRQSRPGSNRILMSIQLAECALGHVLLLVPALLWLGIAGPQIDGTYSLLSGPGRWAAEVGSSLGWTALILAAGAIAYRQTRDRRSISPDFIALAGMTVLGLLSCTIFKYHVAFDYPAVWGFRSLVLGWSIYAAVIAMATWWIASLRTEPDAQGPPQALIRVAAVWVRVAALAAVALGLWGSLHYEEQLYSAAAIAIASLASATMAVWRRREGWALAATVGVNLAASIVVWHYHWDTHLGLWWVDLVQANIIASASVALVWLAALGRLSQLREPSIKNNPLLTFQVTLPAVGQMVLCLQPVVHLIYQPEQLPDWVTGLGCPVSWLALALVVAAAGWHSVNISRENVLSVAVAAVLGAVTLATCHTVGLIDFGSYYFLITALAVVGLLVAAVGMFAGSLPALRTYVPRQAVAAWATAIGVLVIVLSTIHCHEDPYRPWWFASTLLSVSITAGLLAVCLRRTFYVAVSGLLLNVIGTICWYVWRGNDPAGVWSLVETNVLCLGIGSVVWSVVGLLHNRFQDWVPWPRLCGHALHEHAHDKREHGTLVSEHPRGTPAYFISYTQLSAAVALFGTLGLVAVRLVYDVVGIEHLLAEPLSWISLGVTAAAMAMLLTDCGAGWSRVGLYVCGLAAVGLALDARGLDGRMLAWVAAIELAEFALVAALVGWALTRWLPGWHWPMNNFKNDNPRVPGTKRSDVPEMEQAGPSLRHGQSTQGYSLDTQGIWYINWFSSLQQIVVVTAAVLSGWVAFAPEFDACSLGVLAGRMAGPIAAVVLLLTSLIMARQLAGICRGDWQRIALLLVPTVLCCAGWWRLPVEGPSFWIHHAVVLLAALTLGTMVSGLVVFQVKKLSVSQGVPGNKGSESPDPKDSGPPLRYDPATLVGKSDWLAPARWVTGALGVLTIVTLACVFGLEVYFNEPDGTPMAPWAIATVASVLAGLIAGLIAVAVLPGRESTGRNMQGRKACVYAAELIGALLGVHLWLTVPEWFRLGIIERYWIYLVMGVAFVGAGLAEWFQRRRLGVLAEPLSRTALALPLAAAVGFWFIPSASPAFWFLAALFYGVMAISRHNGWLAAVAVATGNMGLWVLWHQQGLHFVDRPQLWLIPAALCALVAEYLHHDRLQESQSAAIRYMALSVIYVSSTVEFMRGVGESVWLPLVLVGLSVLGVMTGIVFRIRSFVYLGVTFLMVVIVRMILYAAFEQGQMWIFWSAVTCLGLAIIALFAVFEKRRNDVLDALERFKRWES